MKIKNWQVIENAKQGAIEVLLHNIKGPFHGLPRTAAWGYPEPYTRDLMLSVPGILVSGNQVLIASIKRTLEVLSMNQSDKGHIPSMVHDPKNRGASDTTPLFLLAVGMFRTFSGDHTFLEEAVQKSLTWMEYQSPSDEYLVAQQPTSDWRDEQWVLGFGLYVNTIVYSYLQVLNQQVRAAQLKKAMQHFTITSMTNPHHLHEGMVVKKKPYYALWSYKIYSSERFDLLGNSIAILSGLASAARAKKMICWIEEECEELKIKGELAVNLAPNFFPFIQPEDADWKTRYAIFNQPGDYHNGGIWPFISALHIAALVTAGKYKLAKEKLYALTELISISRNKELKYGFNEWYKAQTGQPMGQDWQTWSAALYLYAVSCVEKNSSPFFSAVDHHHPIQ
ncbi:glycoside hydrolase 100 family protein [Pedobacter gandavensis]|uniref:glycoside hydrolase 100 family protein n=1 Tax=Pedobacter gandavensis TaxID=2679963 RepID=UPI0024799B91|nr:glycoside hydrolase 100 family protein [Pedobacter gandavensis]WGQ09823.1 glycoside hydrolase 100 family protein [Pedobacter gandavensis]